MALSSSDPSPDLVAASPTLSASPSPQPARVAFQGVLGAYSHQATLALFPTAEAIACASFDDAFLGVEQGKFDRAVIPIENTRGGRVAEIHLLINETPLYITAEMFLPVHHYLLGTSGAQLNTIKTVRSHPQALAQCRTLIRSLNLQQEASADTAGAAKAVAEQGDPTVAAIASETAAAMYGLEILKPRIEDDITNTTRFVVMERTQQEPNPGTGATLTSLIFQVRSHPAALYKALGGFATNGVNMVKIESYLVGDTFSAARFYAEVEGHISDHAVRLSIEELQMFTSYFRVVGCYPSAPERQLG